MQATGAAAAGAALSNFGFDLTQVAQAAGALRIAGAKETATICCYCSVGCGAIVSTADGKVINIEGDPDHPINEGTLCSKGQSLYQIANVDSGSTGVEYQAPGGTLYTPKENVRNTRRLTKVMYRAAGAKNWEEKDWDWAMKEIAKRVKATRDATFKEKDEKGITVNRTEGLAQLGGAAHDNEECYLLTKLARALGIVYLEHQARI